MRENLISFRRGEMCHQQLAGAKAMHVFFINATLPPKEDWHTVSVGCQWSFKSYGIKM